MTLNLLREHAEQQYAAELQALAQADTRPRPPNWRLSPWAVATYVLSGIVAGLIGAGCWFAFRAPQRSKVLSGQDVPR